MKDNSRQLLEKAERSIDAAETLLREDLPEVAAGRAYYAMFLNEAQIFMRTGA